MNSVSLILALRGRRARAGESRRSIAPGGYTLDRAHTAHALTLTGALVRRGAVGAETRADRDGDGSRRSDGCRLPDDPGRANRIRAKK